MHVDVQGGARARVVRGLPQAHHRRRAQPEGVAGADTGARGGAPPDGVRLRKEERSEKKIGARMRKKREKKGGLSFLSIVDWSESVNISLITFRLLRVMLPWKGWTMTKTEWLLESQSFLQDGIKIQFQAAS
nr:uncharacterized protein LOC107279931 [Oryza sativa Japonica Group]